ncbi:MAG TPA: PIN domain-containing protein [Gemmataceae bacterium]|nr:PIN domain-containing protein [Gemmataceae bacterium]
MNAVFLDTVGLLALWDVADQWHAAAEAAYQAIVARRRPFVTTTFVLLECGNAAARRPYRAEVGVLRRTLEQRQELIRPTEQDWTETWEAYERGDAGQAGIVDHVSFAVMRRLGLTQAFTNDRHFRTAGFEPLF